MDISASIRHLYAPLQPTVKQHAGNVSYSELLPSLPLQPYIYCYWQLKTLQPLTEPFIYRVVADGCIDIFFELNNPDESYVMGICNQYMEFALENEFHYAGVRFLPTMFPQIFGIDASEIRNNFVKSDAINKETSLFISTQFSPGLDFYAVKTKLDNFFTRFIDNKSFSVDLRMYNALQLIFKNDGILNVEKDLDVGLSPRQLRRLFHFYIGDSPKAFSKIIRFQNILKAKPSTQSLRENKIFFDAGFYDQPHFIKEFKNFYGITPAKAFES